MDHFEQLSNRIRIVQRRPCFPIGTDSMLLADFLTLRPSAVEIADLGCGAGNIAFLLAGRHAQCRVTGIELDAAACDAARESVKLNRLESRVQILNADLRQIRTVLPGGGFHAAVCNPPYFAENGGKPAQTGAASRAELTCSLREVCDAAGWLVHTGGLFAMVHRTERLCDVFCQLRQSGFEPKRLRFVRHRAGAKARIFLVESRRGGKPGLTLEDDLILFADDGAPSADYRRTYHMDGGSEEAIP